MYLIKAKDDVNVFDYVKDGEDLMYTFNKDSLFTTDGVIVSVERTKWINCFIVVTAVDNCKSYEHYVARHEANRPFKSILNIEFDILCEF